MFYFVRRNIIIVILSAVLLVDDVSSFFLPYPLCDQTYNYYVNENYEIYWVLVFENDFSGRYTLDVEMSVPIFTEKNMTIIRQTPESDIKIGKPIEYHALFPSSQLFSKLTRVVFQGKLVCVGPSHGDKYVTILPARDVVDVGAVSNVQTEPTSPKYEVVPTTQISTNISDGFPNDPECGQTKDYIPLVVNGDETSSGEFPWLVAIFITNVDNDYKFQCAGNLITKNHVVTAAHCVTQTDGTIINKRSLLLILGKNDIKYWPVKSQRRSAIDIHVHQDFKEPSDGDVAIIVLDSPAIYGRTVKPVCVWNEDSNLELIVNQFGSVAGWGRDENATEIVDIARKVDLAVVTNRDCTNQDKRFSSFISQNTFCAGTGKGAVPCTGDSGGGFVMKRSDNKFYIRGVVSATLRSGKERCDVTKNTVFSDIAKYVDWMNNIVQQY